MSQSRLRRFGLAVSVLVTVSAVVSGCALVPVAGYFVNRVAHVNTDPNSVHGMPVAGDCWRGTYDGVIQFADWNTTEPVKCSSKHQLYTFAVLKLKSKHTGSEFTSADELKSSVLDDAYARCNQYQDSSIGDPDPTDGRLKLKAYVPRNAQWAAGARWVRCDYNVYALGSSVTDATLENMPSFSVLRNDIQNDPGIFDFCVNVPGGTLAEGPKVDDGVFASCSSHPEWVLRGYFSVLPLVSTPYPTAAEFATVYQQQCQSKYSDVTHVTFPYYPSKSDWGSGEKAAECWVGQKS